MIDATFRSIETWPAERTAPGKRLGTGRFKSTYNATLNLLEDVMRVLRSAS